MSPALESSVIGALEGGPSFRFADWPVPSLPSDDGRNVVTIAGPYRKHTQLTKRGPETLTLGDEPRA